MMQTSTKVFLVLLRLAIGWHLLVEGLEKVQTADPACWKSIAGILAPSKAEIPPDTKPWTSEVYLRENTGPWPVGDAFRWIAGDPMLDKLTLKPLAPDQDPTKVPAGEQFPPALRKDWDAYQRAYLAFYHLMPGQSEGDESNATEAARAERTRRQDELRALAQKTMQQSEDAYVQWLRNGKVTIQRKGPNDNAPVEVEKSVQEWLDEYREAVAAVRKVDQGYVGTFGSSAYDKVLDAKKNVTSLRSGLQKALDSQTAEMKERLQEILPSDKKAQGPVPGPIVRPLTDYTMLDWVDWKTRWGLTIFGACLLLGFLTRPAALGGAVLVTLFYLAMPPFPWLPENPKAEGHYLFINKNIIEILALLVLVTVPSGRWLGLDGLLQFLNPWRYGRSAQPAPAAPSQRQTQTSVTRA